MNTTFFFTRPEVVLTDLRAFLPCGLDNELKKVVSGHFTLLTVLEACYARIRYYCMKDRAEEKENHLPPMDAE